MESYNKMDIHDTMRTPHNSFPTEHERRNQLLQSTPLRGGSTAPLHIATVVHPIMHCTLLSYSLACIDAIRCSNFKKRIQVPYSFHSARFFRISAEDKSAFVTQERPAVPSQDPRKGKGT